MSAQTSRPLSRVAFSAATRVGHFVAAHRSGALTTVMQAVSTVGDPAVLAAVTAGADVLQGVIRRSWGPVIVTG